MYYYFERTTKQVLFCTNCNCLWYCELKKKNPTLDSMESLIRKINRTLSYKKNYDKIIEKDSFFWKLSKNVQSDFHVIYQEETYYLCYLTLDNQIYYTILNDNGVSTKLISSDSFHFYKPKNLKLAALLETNYLFSIQNTSQNQEALIFLPLTSLAVPTALFYLTTSCSFYELVTLNHFIYLVFPFHWENYVLNLYCFDPIKNEWDFVETLTTSEYCFEYFNLLYDHNILHIIYTIDIFGIHFLYYKSISMNKKNALIDKDKLSLYQSTGKLLYKTGLKITPTLRLKDNLLWINWIEDNEPKSICKSILSMLYN